ncbi:hypothetical protein H4219_000901 [Mycoemilia scoparia]|uniref:Peptidase M20 dimerisation domain-containing protein n=1 Tax=Mycoemilia scoparia TaxID=417184 RepID=A0A9W8DWF1_9FUNG|nr:hypothetical protein H4219_000901 [Mycoemilia scoparia]
MTSPALNSVSFSELSRSHSSASLYHPLGPSNGNTDSLPVRCLQTLSQKSGQQVHSPAPFSDAASSMTTSTQLTDSDAVMSLAHTERYVFSGSQNGNIYVWDRDTYQLEHTMVEAHKRSVLALVLDDDNDILFSAGGDGKVKAWDAKTFAFLYLIIPGDNVGAVLSLAYSKKHQVLVLGCQNTSIQWFSIKHRHEANQEDKDRELAARRSKFFDNAASCGQVDESILKSIKAKADAEALADYELVHSPLNDEFVIFDNSIIPHAHYGFVYALLIGTLPETSEREILFSAAGDGEIKLWEVTETEVKPLKSMYQNREDIGNIHSLVVDDGMLVAGFQGGVIEIWDLETMQKIKVLRGHTDDILSLAFNDHHLYSASADGTIRIWGPNFDAIASFDAHPAERVLSMMILADEELIVSGGSDNTIKFWEIPFFSDSKFELPHANGKSPAVVAKSTASPKRRIRNQMLTSLDQWVGIKSVSDVPELQTECRKAARYLRDLMRQLGAIESQLIPGEEGRNPIVYGRFGPSGSPAAQAKVFEDFELNPHGEEPLTPAVQSDKHLPANAPTVLVYGHYDVMPSGDQSQWDTDPFKMAGSGGYLYGRGVTDDKGPVLAILFAVADLQRENKLDMDVVFCIEGEEEAGSIGLYQAVENHRNIFGQPKLILLSSSYWLGEQIPCLTYGMRGSIRASIEIESSRNADVHSGVWGGAATEPLTWLSHILSKISSPDGRVLVPGFEDGVAPVTESEEKNMRELVHTILTKEEQPVMVGGIPFTSHQKGDNSGLEEQLYNQLMKRWRFPTLSVHHITVSTSASRENTTLIPSAARADISMRVVPKQSINKIADQFQDYVTKVFNDILSESSSALAVTGNAQRNMKDELKLHLTVNPVARWWLADPNHPFSSAAREAIAAEWNSSSGSSAPSTDPNNTDPKEQNPAPLLIREGGSIPAVPWLEEFFGPDATIINLPMGQSTDNAHMSNERIKLVNLVKGRNVVSRLLQLIGPHFNQKQ